MKPDRCILWNSYHKVWEVTTNYLECCSLLIRAPNFNCTEILPDSSEVLNNRKMREIAKMVTFSEMSQVLIFALTTDFHVIFMEEKAWYLLLSNHNE